MCIYYYTVNTVNGNWSGPGAVTRASVGSTCPKGVQTRYFAKLSQGTRTVKDQVL